MNTIKPKTKITYTGKNHVEMAVTCQYPAGKKANTADSVWDLVQDFTSIKTILTNIVRIYITYPDQTQNRVGTIRDMTFGGDPLSIGIEQLTALDEKQRSLTYISLAGLPVTDYVGTLEVSGDNACTLTWTVNYNQAKRSRKLAQMIAGFFVQGEIEIAKVLNLY